MKGFMQSEDVRRPREIAKVPRQLFDAEKKNLFASTDLPLRTGDVARLLNIHTNTVRRWSRRGILKTYRVGPRGDRRFMPKDVLNLLQKLA